MRTNKKIIVLLIGYMGLVIVFESFLGLIQPRSGDTMVITSFEIDGKAINRVVSRLEQGSDIFVAVNHWPRAWARRISENPNVQITYNETTLSYNAVLLEGGEIDFGNVDKLIGTDLDGKTKMSPLELSLILDSAN